MCINQDPHLLIYNEKDNWQADEKFLSAGRGVLSCLGEHVREASVEIITC
jgi:hypothetical protein